MGEAKEAEVKRLRQEYDAKAAEDEAKLDQHEQMVVELQKEVDELFTSRDEVCTQYKALQETHEKLAAEVTFTEGQQSTHTNPRTVNLERCELELRTYRIATRVNAEIERLAGRIRSQHELRYGSSGWRAEKTMAEMRDEIVREFVRQDQLVSSRSTGFSFKFDATLSALLKDWWFTRCQIIHEVTCVDAMSSREHMNFCKASEDILRVLDDLESGLNGRSEMCWTGFVAFTR